MPSSGGQQRRHDGVGGLPARLPLAAAPPFLRPVSLPARPLLCVGLLQMALGCSLLALNFGAMWLSSAPPVQNARSVWVGCSVILAGILGLMTWRKPSTILANLFVLLSVICVLLNLAGFILGCQGIQFVSSVPKCDLVDMDENKTCLCCGDLDLSKCTEEEAALKLYHLKSCSASHLLLKKVLFALCALDAVTAAICLVAAALHYLQIFATRRSCIGESQMEDQGQVFDPDDFVLPALPPSYSATSYTQRTSCRVRVTDAEVFCTLYPPPPYETVWNLNSSEQEDPLQRNVVEVVDSGEVSDRQASPGEEIPEPSSRVSLSPSNTSPLPAEGACRRTFSPLRKRSKSDPALHSWLLQGAGLGCGTAKKTEVKPQLCAVTLWKHSRARASCGRHPSLTDYKSCTDTKQPAAWTREPSSCSVSPDIHKLVENIESVLKSDEKHVAEAMTSATLLDQVMTPAQQAMSLSARLLPSRRHPGLLHRETCGDLSTFTIDEDQLAEKDPESRAQTAS